MSGPDDGQRFCFEIADLPRTDPAWLAATASAVEEAMGERLSGALLPHAVVADPEIRGIRVFFEIGPEGSDAAGSLTESLMDLVREVIDSRPPSPEPVPA